MHFPITIDELFMKILNIPASQDHRERTPIAPKPHILASHRGRPRQCRQPGFAQALHGGTAGISSPTLLCSGFCSFALVLQLKGASRISQVLVSIITPGAFPGARDHCQGHSSWIWKENQNKEPTERVPFSLERCVSPHRTHVHILQLYKSRGTLWNAHGGARINYRFWCHEEISDATAPVIPLLLT